MLHLLAEGWSVPLVDIIIEEHFSPKTKVHAAFAIGCGATGILSTIQSVFSSKECTEGK